MLTELRTISKTWTQRGHCLQLKKGKKLHWELNSGPCAWQSMLLPTELLLLLDNAPENCRISGYHSCWALDFGVHNLYQDLVLWQNVILSTYTSRYWIITLQERTSTGDLDCRPRTSGCPSGLRPLGHPSVLGRQSRSPVSVLSFRDDYFQNLSV